jgi:hypothetical protein
MNRGVVAARLPGSLHHHHRIVVAAEDRDTAALIAAQVVSCQWMCTGFYDRI